MDSSHASLRFSQVLLSFVHDTQRLRSKASYRQMFAPALKRRQVKLKLIPAGRRMAGKAFCIFLMITEDLSPLSIGRP